MATQQESGAEKPHVVLFPFPAQGHVKPALQLAKLLHHCHGFQITFVHTEHNSRRILHSRGPGALASTPGFRFAAVPDGLPLCEVDVPQDIGALLFSLKNMVPHFRNLVADLEPVTCVISDIEHILRAATEIALPCVALWTMSASAFMAFEQCQQLLDRGIIPLKDPEQLTNGYLDSTVVDRPVPGMPKDMRLRDLPSFIRTTQHDDAVLAIVRSLMECYRTVPSAVIVHTFDELEREVITAMSTILPSIYTVGPLPLLLGQVGGSAADTLGSNLSKENHACLEWLTGKRPNSVVYVSFGSIALEIPTSEQLVEFAWGLANSGHEFLWVIRNDQANGGAGGDPATALPPVLWEEIKERSCMTSWCPQDAVLRHEAIGAFLTHCGWNSVLESISAGVPMLCWPLGADQQTNSRYACSEWRVGMEISGNVKRDEVEAAVREVMEGDKGKGMKRMAVEWKEKATVTALPGGPSWINLEKLVSEVLMVPLVEKHTQI